MPFAEHMAELHLIRDLSLPPRGKGGPGVLMQAKRCVDELDAAVGTRRSLCEQLLETWGASHRVWELVQIVEAVVRRARVT
jgi:hypothetical protein